MTMAAFQEHARAYVAAGVVPLPIAPDGKRPMIRHPEKFGRRAAIELLPKFPTAALGFWCGSHNRLTVVDIDSTADVELQHALDRYGDSPVIVRTATGKAHAYYRHNGERRRIRPDRSHPIDLLGEGGLCIAPPSTRPNEAAYRFLRGGLHGPSQLAHDTAWRAGFPRSGPCRSLSRKCPTTPSWDNWDGGDDRSTQ
jgi:hypothetical protein